MRWLDDIVDSMDMTLNQLQEIVDRGAFAFMGSQRVRHNLVTEQHHTHKYIN